MVEVLARVAAIWRYPVKSFAGEEVTTAGLGAGGITGDRRFALVEESGRLVTAKRHGRLLEASATTRADGTVEVRLPDGTVGTAGEPTIDAAISAWLGMAVRLIEAGAGEVRTFEMSLDAEHPDDDLFEWPALAGTHQDLAAVHLLTTASLGTAAGLAPNVVWDVRRFRPTVLLDVPTAGGEPWPEDSWVGRRLSIGDAVIEVTMPTIRCPMPSRSQPGLERDTRVAATLRDHHENNLGVYADTVTPGTIAVGDVLASV